MDIHWLVAIPHHMVYINVSNNINDADMGINGATSYAVSRSLWAEYILVTCVELVIGGDILSVSIQSLYLKIFIGLGSR